MPGDPCEGLPKACGGGSPTIRQGAFHVIAGALILTSAMPAFAEKRVLRQVEMSTPLIERPEEELAAAIAEEEGRMKEVAAEALAA